MSYVRIGEIEEGGGGMINVNTNFWVEIYYIAVEN